MSGYDNLVNCSKMLKKTRGDEIDYVNQPNTATNSKKKINTLAWHMLKN